MCFLKTRQDQIPEKLSYNHHDAFKKKRKIRSLILQGGGALGAFQAGAFKALYEKITNEHIQNRNEGRPCLILLLVLQLVLLY